MSMFTAMACCRGGSSPWTLPRPRCNGYTHGGRILLRGQRWMMKTSQTIVVCCPSSSSSSFSSHSSSSSTAAVPIQVPSLPLFQNALRHPHRVAISQPQTQPAASSSNDQSSPHASSSSSSSYSYAQLLHDSYFLSLRLFGEEAKEEPTKEKNGRREGAPQRVAFLCPADYSYVMTQWAIWSAAAIAVPVGVKHPLPEIEHVLRDCDASVFVYHPQFAAVADNLRTRFAHIRFLPVTTPLPSDLSIHPTKVFDINMENGASIIYTSGTTGKPKGVLTTHANVEAQVAALTKAWLWSKDDSILNVLPLHHVHGIIAVVTSALHSGARCEMMPSFDSKAVWQRFMDSYKDSPSLSLFMAVPTIYSRLLDEYRNMDAEQQSKASEACKQFRLMVSGSMALPEVVMKEWEKVSGHILLERYGMSEFAMAISNPVNGTRKPGCVGKPLPGYQVRIVPAEHEGNNKDKPTSSNEGELQVKGAGVFKCYWNRKEATAESFTPDGWFKTGDIAEYADEEGTIRILGRASVDILKSGGYKISALEVERVLLEHSSVTECAVIGLPDTALGQRVAAVLVLDSKKDPKNAVENLKLWLKDKLSTYKSPRSYFVLSSAIPRNAMGKVNKKDLLKFIQENHDELFVI
ncbi:Peroxisomal AMP binding enzyme [Balamuthia mandrillaris]